MCAYVINQWRDLLSLIGLLLVFAGALATALPMRVSSSEAGKLAVARIAPSSESEWARMPAAVALLKNSKGAMHGLWLIALGSALQAVPLIVGLFI